MADHGLNPEDARSFWDAQFRARATSPPQAVNHDEQGEALDAAVAELSQFIRPESCALEIGCGTGTLLQRVAGLARRVIGVDVSKAALASARAALAGVGNVELIETAGADLSAVAANSVDFVWSTLCFVTVDEATVTSYLAEIARVLDRGGRGWLQFLDADSEAGRLLESQMRGNAWPAHAIARRRIAELCAVAGLDPHRGLESGPWLYVEIRKRG